MRRLALAALALALVSFPPASAGHDDQGCYGFLARAAFTGSLTPELLGDDRVVDFELLYSEPGYYLVTARGSVFAFGEASWFGSAGKALMAGETVIDLVPYSSFEGCHIVKVTGYLLVTDHGRVLSFGNAPHCGSIAADDLLDQQVVQFEPLAEDLSGVFPVSESIRCGYRMLTDHGNVYAFGDATWCGSMPDGALGDQRAVEWAVGRRQRCGYLVVTDRGNAYAFGVMGWSGSMTPEMLGAQRVIGVEPMYTSDTDGYAMFTDEGNIYNFSPAPWPGSYAATGERIVEFDFPNLAFGERGGVFAVACEGFLGSASGLLAAGEVVVQVAMRAGYYLVTDLGHVYVFPATFDDSEC